jgi:hypothetical protein
VPREEARDIAPLLDRTFLATIALTVGCGQPSSRACSLSHLVFLTREGCVLTRQMRGRLDGALWRMGLAADYRVVDLASLSATDHRRGYPTPTLLYGGQDLFGMPERQPPFAHPT